jgi:hypothetical protein
MAHKTSGVILVELPTTRGTTRNGKDWEKREYILESSNRNHTKMRFSVYSWDGPILDAPRVGDKIEVFFSIEAKEVNGTWYNEVKAYCIERIRS